MLGTIHIENIAIMDNVDLSFENGFCVLTGETGAGKSIIIDSVNLLTGERSSKELVRAGQDRAVVEGAVFAVHRGAYDLLEENGIPYEKGEPLILSREITKDGRSMVRINGRISTTGLLKQLCAKLINIHGQHDSQAILDQGFHGDFLDSYAHIQEELADYRQIYEKLQKIKKQLQQEREDQALLLQKIDILTYQSQEIQKAKLRPGEEEELEEARERFLNSEKIVKASNDGFAALYGTEERQGAYDQVCAAADAMEALSAFDAKAAEYAKTLSEMRYTLDDVIDGVRQIKDEAETESVDIDSVENRLDLLYRLKKKYGGTVEDVIARGEELAAELDQIQNSDLYRAKLEQEQKELAAQLEKKAAVLTQKRKAAGEKLSKQVARELSDLDMAKVAFRVELEPVPFYAKGAEKAAFLISTNPGQPPKPLNKIASGGELSRIILALKVVLAETDQVETMIFDEVDTGVSGRAAQKIAEKLKKLSRNKQVFVITHLAQVAAFADAHYLIEKKQVNHNTVSQVTKLEPAGRVQELARIMSGTVVTEHALEAARELLQMAKSEQARP